MKNVLLYGIFAVLLFGIIGTVYAQEISNHVVINEVELNPPGDDSKSVSEWVELYNPTDDNVDVGGWKVASTTVTKKTLTIPTGTTIKPGQFLVYSYASLWFTDVSEKVQLRDKEGNIVDETAIITDQKNDFSSWQRKFDGADSTSSGVWVFRTSSAGSSNGKLTPGLVDSGDLVISVTTDKKNYLFDETVLISGNVSKRVFQEKPSFTQQQLSIHVDGPGKFDRIVTLYPDLNLGYKTQIKLDKVLGATTGTYVVSVKYAGSETNTAFSAGAENAVVAEEDLSVLNISTDREFYLPGQTVTISGFTNKIIPLEGLKFSVYDPKKVSIFSGKLFPNPSGEFTGNVYMTTVKPAYGTFDVIADYGDQHAKTTFDLIQDIKDVNNIILATDKKTYLPGETIEISGRSNKHVAALDLEVIQTGTGSVGKTTNNIFKIKDQVTLAGDSTFKYILNVPAGDTNLGDFRVTVSKEFGTATTDFKIVSDKDQSVLDREYVQTDKEEYVTGDTVNVSGRVVLKQRSTYEAIPVYLSLMDDQGKQISIVAVANKQLKQDKVVKPSATYSFTSIPDAAGNFKLDFKINSASFKPGVYKIRASYDQHFVDAKFKVTSDIDIRNRNILAKTDKTVYGLGETVKLDGTLVSGQSAVKIILTKPDGKTVDGGAKVNNSRFSWSWTAPITEHDLADIRDPRQERPTVFGTYKISIIATSERADLSFKLSKNPQTDTSEIKPLEVNTDKQVYFPGEKLFITGSAIKRQENVDTSIGTIRDRVSVEIRTMSNKVIFTSNLDLDNSGAFKTTYDLPVTVFKEGKYKVVATYQKLRADTTFEIKNNIPFGNTGKIVLTMETDKQEYLPGDIVHITGSSNKILSLHTLDLAVNLQKDDDINCGKFYCGLGGKQVDISRNYQNGFYKYDYKIPANAALGTYVITLDTGFDTFTKTFKVVDKITKIEMSSKISEKFSKITDKTVDVELFEKTIDEQNVAPSILQGSLITPRGSEKTINVTITADDGQCIIGQSNDCLVSKSTKGNDVGYKTVTVAGINYKVTYSGSEPILEKFIITPESTDDVIPNSYWTIQIEGDENQSSKLYYEIVYNVIQ